MSAPAATPERRPAGASPAGAEPTAPPAAALPQVQVLGSDPQPASAPPRVTVVEPPSLSLDGVPRMAPDAAVQAQTPDAPGDHVMNDYFDWATENDVSESARDETKPARKLSMRNMSPGKLLLILTTTFFGNLVLVGIMLVPILVVHFVYRDKNRDDPHKVYIADNVEAWFIWAAFNLHLQWWIHFLVELVPPTVLGVVKVSWGPPGQRIQSCLEYYRAMSGYLKLVFYAALNWGSWTIIFNPIYGLASERNPRENSRATYTWRIYQVMEFIVRIPASSSSS